MLRVVHCCLLVTFLSSTSYADGDFRTVALSNGQVPGSDNGVLFDSFSNPTLNASGQVAFTSVLTGTGVNGANDTGVYSEGSGALTQVAREGNQAPSVGSGVLFGEFTISSPLLNALGQTAFRSSLTGAVNGGNDSVVYSEGSGVLAAVSREGDQAPGAPPGVLFGNFSANPSYNDAGQAAFFGRLTGPGVALGNDRGIYSQGPGTISEIARAGGQAPGAPAGTLFFNFDSPAFNSAGQTVFTGELTGAGVTGVNDEAVYSEGTGALAEVARAGSQAPNAAPGVVFSNFTFPGINAVGQTVFSSDLTGPGVTSANNEAVYSEGTGVLTEVARSGNQVPGEVAGVLFSGFGNPVINDAGQSAFTGDLTGTGVSGGTDRGVYSEGTGTLAQVAREGQSVPGGGLLRNFVGFPVINALGQTGFTALIGFGGTLERGIFATDVNGQLVSIVREGDVIDVNDDPLIDDLRTVSFVSYATFSGNGDGRASGLNDLGQFAFRANFTDGSTGLFVSNLVAVPEPSSLVLAILATASLVRFRYAARALT